MFTFSEPVLTATPERMLSYIFYLLLYPFLLLGFIFLGRKTASHSIKKRYEWKPLGMENGLVGFYGLLVSFALIQSGNYANERQTMIHHVSDDASEILRTSVTFEPELGARIRSYFSSLFKTMEELPGTTPQDISLHIKTIDRLDEEMDKHLSAYIAAHPLEKDEITSLLAKVDRMISTYYRLMHSYHRTIPKLILAILLLFSLLIGFLMGFTGKRNGNQVHVSTTIFIVISFIIMNVINDLDNPSIGIIQPDFGNITEVMETYKIRV